jgi:hypothetical protein
MARGARERWANDRTGVSERYVFGYIMQYRFISIHANNHRHHLTFPRRPVAAGLLQYLLTARQALTHPILLQWECASLTELSEAVHGRVGY